MYSGALTCWKKRRGLDFKIKEEINIVKHDVNKTYLVTSMSTTKLLNGSIRTPRKFQCDVNASSLIFDTTISLDKT